MADPTDSQQSTLQKKAIEKAKSAFARLPHENVKFQRALDGKDSLMDCLDVVERTAISDDHSKATEQISRVLTSIQACLPRLEAYESVQSDQILQIALLNDFVDVVDFAVRAAHYLQQNAFVRLAQTVSRGFDQDIEAIIVRLKEHASHADSTALAVEIRAATAYRELAERRHREESKLRCTDWLKPSDIAHVHERNIHVRLAGTCQWILTSPKFNRWAKPALLISEDRLIVISGSQGRGKSVLSSSIIDGLKGDHQHTLYYAFSNSDRSRQSGENLIRTLLWQLLHISANEEHVNLVQRLRLHGQPTSADFWGAFETIVSSLAEPLFCVIDGFDEGSDFVSTVSTRLKHSLSMCPNLRILLTGRSHVVQEALQNLQYGNIEITAALLDQDIEAFLHDEIAKSDSLSHPKLRQLVYDSLKEKADGMFLYIHLMIKDLKHSSLSIFEVSERLQQLPSGLEEAYGRYFNHLRQKLNKSHFRLVQDTLTFVIASCRPLTIDEIRVAHALQCRSSGAVRRPLKEYISLLPAQQLVDALGGLVTTNKGFLYLSHSSIKDFLVRIKEQWVSDDDKAVLGLKIDLQEAHLTLSRLSLDHIILEGPNMDYKNCNAIAPPQASQTQNPFLDYAILYISYHLNRSGPFSTVIIAKVEHIVKSGLGSTWLDNFAYLQSQDLTHGPQYIEFLHFMAEAADSDVGTNFIASLEHNHKDLINMTQDAFEEYFALSSELEIDNPAHIVEIGPETMSSSSPRSLRVIGTTPPAQTPNVDLQLEDHSLAVSHSITLFQPQARVPFAHQIKIFGALCSSLRKLRPFADPLKVLCQSILGNATSIPAYMLFFLGIRYFNLGKVKDALGFFKAASKQVKYVEVLIKYVIYGAIGICNEELDRDAEASKYYERAYSGFRFHLGRRHKSTLAVLYQCICSNSRLRRHQEVLKLCDMFFQGQDTVLVLGIQYSWVLQCLRRAAHWHLRNQDMVAHTDDCLQDIVTQCHHLKIKDIFEFELNMPVIGPIPDLLQYWPTTLHFVILMTAVLMNSQGQVIYCLTHHGTGKGAMKNLFRRKSNAQRLYESLWCALQRHPESRIEDLLKSEEIMNRIFLTLNALGLCKNAFRLSRIAVEILKELEGPDEFHTLQINTWAVINYVCLESETKVKQFSPKVKQFS